MGGATRGCIVIPSFVYDLVDWVGAFLGISFHSMYYQKQNGFQWLNLHLLSSVTIPSPWNMRFFKFASCLITTTRH